MAVRFPMPAGSFAAAFLERCGQTLSEFFHGRWFFYAAATIAPCAALLLREAMSPLPGEHLTLGLFTAAVLVSALLGGLGPGLLGTSLSIVLAFCFVFDAGSSPFEFKANLVWVLIFALIGVVFAQTAQSLRNAHSQLTNVLNNTTDFFCVFDHQWRFLYVNPQAERYFGASREKMIGHVLWAVYPPVRGSEVEIRFRDAVARKAPVHFETVSAITGRWIEVHGYPIDEGLSVFFRDISERKRAEQQLRGDRERLAGIVAEQNAELSDSQQRLRLSERMVMIGTLAAGLAHDLANLIMPIRLCLHSLEKQDLPPAARDDLQTIGKSADYLQSLAAGLRQVARDPNGTPTAGKGTTLNQWWSEVSPLLRAVLPRHVRLDSALADDSTVLAVPGPRLTQAVLNLVQNAGDALSSARNGWVRLTLDTGSSPDFVILRVIDNGPGMTPDVRRRCMEPFYTTKTRGPGGTGLGLALVHRIVTDAGGEIGVQSGENEGTTFELKLPVSRT